jgi:hypothetical protein
MKSCRFLQRKLSSLGNQAGNVMVEVKQNRQQHRESIPSSAITRPIIDKKSREKKTHGIAKKISPVSISQK